MSYTEIDTRALLIMAALDGHDRPPKNIIGTEDFDTAISKYSRWFDQPRPQFDKLVEYDLPSRLFDESALGKFLHLRLPVVGVTNPAWITLTQELHKHIQTLQPDFAPLSNERFSTRRLVLAIDDYATIQTLPLPGEHLVKTADDLRAKDPFLELTIQPIEVDGHSEFVCWNVRSGAGYLKRLSPPSDFRKRIDSLKMEIAKSDLNTTDFIAYKYISARGIVEGDQYLSLFRTVVLEAFSLISFSFRNGKISILVIGRSGLGKSFPHELAKLINPIFEEAQTSRVSPAGLTGAVTSDRGRFNASPGLLSRANGGVLSMPELQDLNRPDEVFSIAAAQMESGDVILANAAQKKFKAHTGWLMDTNLKSHVKANELKSSPDGRFKISDLGIDVHILNRVHAIFLLEIDPKVLAIAANDALMNAGNISSRDGLFEEFEDIRLLVADALDNPIHASVDIKMRTRLSHKIEEAFESYGIDPIEMRPEISDFRMRLTHAAINMLQTCARCNFRFHPNGEDFLIVSKIVEEKIKVLSRIDWGFSTPGNRFTQRRNKVIDCIIETFKSEEKFTPKDALKVLVEKLELSLDNGTLSRYLKGAVASGVIEDAGYGAYRVRTEEQPKTKN
jgi:hypothetical protein